MHHYTNEIDLNYNKLNVSFIKAFIGSIKVKTNGKHCSFVHIQKFCDAVKFGAEEAHQNLPEEFDREMKQFLLSCKKEVTNEKKKGNLDEQELDPISVLLYELICKWALESNNVLVWVGLCYNGTAWRVWHQLTHWGFIISQKEWIQLLLSMMTARQIMQERKCLLRTFLPILLTLTFVPSWHSWVATSASTKRLSVQMTRSFRRKGRMVLLCQHTAVS